jgi:uncharacterized protein YwqG
MTRELASALVEHHVPDFRDQLDPLLKTSVRITATRLPYDGANLKSKFAGSPLLPGKIPWPTLGPRQVPLRFIAQLHLADLPSLTSIPLPLDGLLLFFYADSTGGSFNPISIGSERVIYLPQDQIPQTPSEPPPQKLPYINSSLDFASEWTLPSDPHEYGIDIPRHSSKAYSQLLQDLYGESPTIHRLGGHSQPIQYDMRLEAQLATNGISAGDASKYDDARRIALQEGVADWQLLLQIDTDEDGPGWMWGDVGRLYFWARRQDLAQRNFDKVWCCEQCY